MADHVFKPGLVVVVVVVVLCLAFVCLFVCLFVCVLLFWLFCVCCCCLGKTTIEEQAQR